MDGKMIAIVGFLCGLLFSGLLILGSGALEPRLETPPEMSPEERIRLVDRARR